MRRRRPRRANVLIERVDDLMRDSTEFAESLRRRLRFLRADAFVDVATTVTMARMRHSNFEIRGAEYWLKP